MKNKLLFLKQLYIYLSLILLITIIMIGITIAGMKIFSEENWKKINRDNLRSISDEIKFTVLQNVSDICKKASELETFKNSFEKKSNTNDILLLLESIKKINYSMIVYIMNHDGIVTFSSISNNIDITGNNYSFRPYFKNAINGSDYIYPAVGITTGERGLYFSSPIYSADNEIKGTLIIKHGLNSIDKILNKFKIPIAFVSPEGIIISSNKKELLLKTIAPLGDEEIKKIKENLQFPDIKYEYLNINNETNKLILSNKEYILTELNFEIPGWKLISFNPVIKKKNLTKIQKIFFTVIIISILLLSVIIHILIITNENRIITEKKYKMLFQNANEGIILLSKDSKTIFFNKKVIDITGYTSNDIKEMDIFNLVHDDHKTQVLNNFQRRLNGEDIPKMYEIKIYAKDHEIRWVHLNIMIIDWDQKPAALVFLHDITARKQTLKAYEESEVKYKLLVEAMQEGLIIIDISNNITFTNNAFCKIVDKKKEEVLNSSINNVFKKEKISKMFADFEHLKKHRIESFQWDWIDRDNNQRACLVTPSPITDSNNIYLGTIIVFSDITELINLQNRLINSEKLELIGRLAGGVAHDLNNILSGLVSIPDYLLQSNTYNEETTDSLKTIKKSGEKAAAIVNDLLTLSRRKILKKEIININKIVHDVITSHVFKDYIKDHSDIIIKFAPELKLKNISGSSVYIENAIMNLVSNAMEAMPEGGVIYIKTENSVESENNINKEYVIITVEDTGTGIPEQDLKRIFEPFYSKKIMGRSGTGLGLAIVLATIKDHNGIIDVKTEMNKGTKFKIKFPIINEQITMKQEKNDLYFGNKEKIMVVDDDAIQRELSIKILTKLNYDVITFSNGKDAIEYLKINDIDLVLLDMIFGNGMDGLDIYQKILEFKKKQKVIVVSGYADLNAINEAKKLGVINFIAKPYTIKIISEAIYEALNS